MTKPITKDELVKQRDRILDYYIKVEGIKDKKKITALKKDLTEKASNTAIDFTNAVYLNPKVSAKSAAQFSRACDQYVKNVKTFLAKKGSAPLKESLTPTVDPEKQEKQEKLNRIEDEIKSFERSVALYKSAINTCIDTLLEQRSKVEMWYKIARGAKYQLDEEKEFKSGSYDYKKYLEYRDGIPIDIHDQLDCLQQELEQKLLYTAKIAEDKQKEYDYAVEKFVRDFALNAIAAYASTRAAVGVGARFTRRSRPVPTPSTTSKLDAITPEVLKLQKEINLLRRQRDEIMAQNPRLDGNEKSAAEFRTINETQIKDEIKRINFTYNKQYDDLPEIQFDTLQRLDKRKAGGFIEIGESNLKSQDLADYRRMKELTKNPDKMYDNGGDLRILNEREKNEIRQSYESLVQRERERLTKSVGNRVFSKHEVAEAKGKLNKYRYDANKEGKHYKEFVETLNKFNDIMVSLRLNLSQRKQEYCKQLIMMGLSIGVALYLTMDQIPKDKALFQVSDALQKWVAAKNEYLYFLSALMRCRGDLKRRQQEAQQHRMDLGLPAY